MNCIPEKTRIIQDSSLAIIQFQIFIFILKTKRWSKKYFVELNYNFCTNLVMFITTRNNHQVVSGFLTNVANDRFSRHDVQVSSESFSYCRKFYFPIKHGSILLEKRKYRYTALNNGNRRISNMFRNVLPTMTICFPQITHLTFFRRYTKSTERFCVCKQSAFLECVVPMSSTLSIGHICSLTCFICLFTGQLALAESKKT